MGGRVKKPGPVKRKARPPLFGLPPIGVPAAIGLTLTCRLLCGVPGSVMLGVGWVATLFM